MDTNNLTPLQKDLLDELVNEFNKLNPKPKSNAAKRFTFDSINECQNEEKRFLETIEKHNLTMMKVFIGQLGTELKEFNKEFGKALEIQIGHSKYATLNGTIENIMNNVKANPTNFGDYNEILLFFASKTKEHKGDSSYDFCFGKKYVQLFVGFKKERVSVTLLSGKIVSAYKIVGLEYCTHNYHNKEKGTTRPTLDELVQEDKTIQQKIVELVV